jgi:short-subunit dehydrogenase
MNGENARYALVTGASGGLGSAFALQAARKGWNLLLVDLPGTGLREVGRRLERVYRVQAQCFEMDISDSQARGRLRDWIEGAFINLELLVNNAGTGSQGSFETSPLSRMAASIDVNVQATMQMTYLLLPTLRRQSRSVILNVASLAAFYPMPVLAVYAATKSFILNFSLAVRAELAGTGVTVSALCPAGMMTSRETADAVRAQGLIGRITTWEPERVAAVALRQAMRGKAIIVPGILNNILRYAGEAVPRALVVGVIGSRWRKAERELGRAAGQPA